MPPSETTSLLAREECKSVMKKLDTLQRLLNDTGARQILEAHDINLSLQAPLPSIDFGYRIDLETDNLPNHFSKLWLREEPDEIFFHATHPALVELRQEQIPRWKQSSRWKNWSESVVQCKYQQLKHFDLSLLPNENECRQLCQIYMSSCNWYYELLTETECEVAQAEMYAYQYLGLTCTTSEQWIRIALVLAICRLALSCLDWVEPDKSVQFSKKRGGRIGDWCDLSVMALHQANFDQNTTIEALRVLIILTSTIFFETDCGLMGGSPQMLKLHRLAIDFSERLELNREPPGYLSSKEKDDRRRMWWALVTNDSHFCATGTASSGPLGLQYSDTKYPAPRESETTDACAAENSAHLNLRSACSRFELGKFNNRYCQLLSQRRPLATLADIWKLDKDLIAMEASVLPEQRLISDLDLMNFSRRPLQLVEIRDNELRYAQQIFYTGFWHIRSKIHRGLFFTKQSLSHTVKSKINFDAHRDIVRRCSYCMLHLYRHIKLPTAFTSAIASAALTVLLELTYQPSRPFNREIRTIVLECLSRLQTDTSPVIGRACQVLEYFFERIRPHVEISRDLFESFPNKRQKINPSVIVNADSSGVSDNVSSSYIHVSRESYHEASGQNNEAFIVIGSSGLPDGREMRVNSTHADFESTCEQRATCSIPRVTTGQPSTFIDPRALFKFQHIVPKSCIEDFFNFRCDSYSGDTQVDSRLSSPPGSLDFLKSPVLSSNDYGKIL